MNPIVFVLALLAPNHADLAPSHALPVVVRIVNLKVVGKTVHLKLRSGRTVRIGVNDYDIALSDLVMADWQRSMDALNVAEQAEPSEHSAETEAAATVGTLPAEPPMSSIRAKCATEWPDDFAMRKYCEDLQIKAFKELQGR